MEETDKEAESKSLGDEQREVKGAQHQSVWLSSEEKEPAGLLLSDFYYLRAALRPFFLYPAAPVCL
jgi:hypothetical protein